MSNLALKIENVTKKYQIKHNLEGASGSLKEILNYPFRVFAQRRNGSTNNLSVEPFYALNDVSFDIMHGESVGLIGRNGAGKSTLLKILSRIVRPSSGRVILYEKVNSLLEVGTGFNTELTGRDNIFLNGSFLGMSRREIQEKYQEIVDFSEIEQFIDTPVKYYSSGMFVRLAFSVAVHLTPETLLLDEVLAVGDAEFQKKSQRKMYDLLNSGATIVFVSHNAAAVREICKRCVWLEHGRIKMDGPSDLVLDEYAKNLNTE